MEHGKSIKVITGHCIKVGKTPTNRFAYPFKTSQVFQSLDTQNVLSFSFPSNGNTLVYSHVKANKYSYGIQLMS